MPPRFVYWTIIFGGQPTSFRAGTRDELLPTFKQIQSKHPDAQLRYFARGKLWYSEEEARADLIRARRPAFDRPPFRPRPEGDRPPGPPRDARGPRPEWKKDRPQGGDRPQWKDRPPRDARGPRPEWKKDRPQGRDRPQWKDRPPRPPQARDGDRGPRPEWKKDRPQGGDRPQWKDRPPRDSRGPKPDWKNRPQGGAKPPWKDRPTRNAPGEGRPPGPPKPRGGEGGKDRWRDRPQGPPGGGDRRGRDWRPGGEHKDPRDRFKVPRDVKRARFKDRAQRDRMHPKPPKKKDEE
jgi:hypothetical protein